MNKMIKMAAIATISMAAFSNSALAATYTVKPGDDLWSVAVQNGLTGDKLMVMNNLSSYALKPGQTLQVPDKLSYAVTGDDTFWKISQKLGVPVKKLIAANPQIANPNNIWEGLILNVPQKPQAHLDAAFPLPKGSYQPFVDDYGTVRAWSPSGYATRSHEGVDISAPKGTPVMGAMDGTISNIGWNQYGGWRITIKVDGSTAFYYAHLSKYADGMALGKQVKKGQVIGYVGNTGYGPEGTEGKFDPHLHFGIYKTNAGWTTANPYANLKWWELG